MSKSKPSPNDQRSNVKNPNNAAYKHAQDNRSVQLNPNAAPSESPAPAKPAEHPAKDDAPSE